MPANVAKMHIEDFVAGAEVADHVENLDARVVQHLAHRALAEVEAVIWILFDGDESLQPLHGAQNPLYALIAGRGNTGVVRVQGHADFVLAGYRDDAVEEVRDAFPRSVGADMTGTSQGCFRFRFRQLPGAVSRVSPPRRAARTQVSDELQVVLDGRNAGRGAVLDHGLQIFD